MKAVVRTMFGRFRAPAGALIVIAIAWAPAAPAQQRPASGAEPSTARSEAPVDLTGYWVSVITEDWAWRMQTPPKGDYASVPLNGEGRRVADSWDESQDGSCLAFGAAAALRMPTRAHITWRDDHTLEIETDNGEQTRLLHFAAAPQPAAPRTLQGQSFAAWQTVGQVRSSGATGGILTDAVEAQSWASLKVVTRDMAAAWLRPNGVPYSENAVMTEYFDRFSDGSDEWLTITTMIDDPTYLTEPFVISSNFKREANRSNWRPKPCRE
jgi:hypothetical protein